MKCKQHIRIARIDGEEMRKHLEEVLRAGGSPSLSVHGHVEDIRSELFTDPEGLPVSAHRTEEKRTDIAIGTSRRETLTVATSRATFNQSPSR